MLTERADVVDDPSETEAATREWWPDYNSQPKHRPAEQSLTYWWIWVLSDWKKKKILPAGCGSPNLWGYSATNVTGNSMSIRRCSVAPPRSAKPLNFRSYDVTKLHMTSQLSLGSKCGFFFCICSGSVPNQMQTLPSPPPTTTCPARQSFIVISDDMDMWNLG